MSAAYGVTPNLLIAKLHRPRVTSDLVVRPRLLALLDEGLTRPVTVVVSPAGFGKTTLVSSWAAEVEMGARPGISIMPSAWVTLDESDSDLSSFLRYFVGALRTLFPHAAVDTLALLSALKQPPAELLASTLSNDIERLPSSFVMILDDAHLLRGHSVSDFLASWMRHWPRPLHMILISRLDPSLPLNSLRAKSRLVEVRPRNLRFTKGETTEYLSRTMDSVPEEPAVDTIHQNLEGWIAGLKLLTLSANAQETPKTLAEVLADGDMQIANYILEDVLQDQPTGLQELLLRLSITRQFCESLGNALMGDDDPDGNIRDYLDYLESNEMFLTALDNRHEWYRLHPLFREQLHVRLLRDHSEAMVAGLHSRAARWYAAQGLIDPALQHALESRDMGLVTEVVQQGLCDVLNRTDRQQLERWLAILPTRVVDRSPELLLVRAWDYAFRWELGPALQAAEQAETLLAKDNPARNGDLPVLIGQIAMLKGQAAYFRHQPDRAVELCREALLHLPIEWDYVRGLAAIFLGTALYAGGDAIEAERFLAGEYSAAANKSSDYALRILLAQVQIALQAGRLETAQQIAQVILRRSLQTGHTVSQGWAYYLLGYIAYQRNDLRVAEEHFAAAAALRYQTQLLVARNGFIGLALVTQAQGKTEQADRSIDDLSQLDIELLGHEDPSTTAARARTLLMRNDLAAADMWSERIELPPALQPLHPWVEEPALTRIKVLIARNQPGDLETVLGALEAMDEIAVRTCSTRSRVEILALRALAQVSRGDGFVARESLKLSVDLARRTGQRRLFVDMGLPMYRLLTQIAGDHAISTTVREIMTAFDDAQVVNSGLRVNGANVDKAATLPDHLTARELEILGLIAEPMSLGEISAQLHIALSTTKRHTINLYQKLGVHSRWQAVAAAKELGILPPR